MTGTHRKLGLIAFLTALAPATVHAAAPSPATPAARAQDVQALFDQGVDLLSRGRDEEALHMFQKVLAANPSHEQAYELFKRTEHSVWLEILTKQGDFELVGKRLMGLAEMGRAERRNDREAILALVGELSTKDPVSRRSAIRQLAAEHGEYAVPYMLPALADSGDEDRRIATMTALQQMNLNVVPPLVAALDANDAYLRRNVALVLGNIGDRRATAALAKLAAGDPDVGAKQSATEALARLGGQGANPVAAFVQLGNGYLDRADGVLSAYQMSDVVWTAGESGIDAKNVPTSVYGEEMARAAFRHALALDPNSGEAQAGLARAQLGEVKKLESLEAAGQDVAALLEEARGAAVAADMVGPQALDAALRSALDSKDYAAAQGLVEALAANALSASEGLARALNSDDGALRSAAAIALGRIAVEGRAPLSAEAVRELANSVGRQVVRMAFVIDRKPERATTIAAALRSQGMLVTTSESGAMGLAMLHRIPGVDVVLVSDSLPDMTTQQVLTGLAEDARYEKTPRLVISDAADAAAELYGESTQGIVTGNDVAPVAAALSENLNRDREEADRLSRLAAETLAHLSAGGADISGALDALAGTLATRPDEVVLPACQALARAGTSGQVPALLAQVADSTKSEEARAAAGDALAKIVARNGGQLSADAAGMLGELVGSDSPLAVRRAAARVLGHAHGQPGSVLRAVRAQN